MSQTVNAADPTMPCPCQAVKMYKDCCAPYHEGVAAAPSAEALMRSRYSAYALHKAAYLYKSWSAQTRPSKHSLKKAKPLAWLSLEIVRTERGGALDDTGIVEFIAKYKDGEQPAQLNEVSKFARENGRWVYVEGDY